MTWIGVDVGKRQLDVSVHEGDSRRFAASDLAALVAFVARENEPRVVLEASGGYEWPLVDALAEAGIACTVVNPAWSHAFRRSVGKLAKTDAQDARLLARLGHVHEPPPTRIPSPERRALADLERRRLQLSKMHTMEKNHAEQASTQLARRSINAVLARLERELAAIKKEIRAIIARSPDLSRLDALFQSVPGVGPMTAAGLLVHLPELGSIGRGQVAALAGLAPYNDDSGARSGKRAVRAGRAPIRALLYMAALSAKKWNPQLRPVYERLVSAGKLKKVALIAVARKLLVQLNAIARSGETWRSPLLPQTPS